MKNKTMGFTISEKENERRRALVPDDILKIRNRESLCFQTSYGKDFGVSDKELEKLGCKVAPLEDVLKCDIICDPKIGDAKYLANLKEGQVIFGWIHATQNRKIADAIINAKTKAFAWEKMFDAGRHIFYKNNEIAGEAAIMHAMTICGTLPLGKKVAVLGNGNIARGAIRVLTMLGADVSVYTRKLEPAFKEEFTKYDIIVNAILWDVRRKDHIIYREDLKKLKKNALIIDISCDRHGGIESCIPTTIENPVYIENGIMHYAVDHTPTILFKSASISISEEVLKYADILMEGHENECTTLSDALIIDNGSIIDKSIIEFQKR